MELKDLVRIDFEPRKSCVLFLISLKFMNTKITRKRKSSWV